MPSQEVLSALESLHREIEKLEPAIKHIEAVQKVTESVKIILKKHDELLTEIKKNESKHKDELKKLFEKELSDILEETKKLQILSSDIHTLAREILSNIPQSLAELLEELKSNDARHKDELQRLFANELRNLAKENKKLQEITYEIQELVKHEVAALAKLRETVQAFHERVERINFPERLDKLDANVAGIMAALQSVQSRLDSLERNITERIKDMLDYQYVSLQKEIRTALQNELGRSTIALRTAVDEAAKKQQTLTYITWVLIVVAIIITFVLNK